jgi:hypothetical protein
VRDRKKLKLKGVRKLQSVIGNLRELKTPTADLSDPG